MLQKVEAQIRELGFDEDDLIADIRVLALGDGTPGPARVVFVRGLFSEQRRAVWLAFGTLHANGTGGIEDSERVGAALDELVRAALAAASRADLWDEIRAERSRQDAKWGGEGHDDEHSNHEWVEFIRSHADKALHHNGKKADAFALFRHQMIRVAALAVAAIESDARCNPSLAARAPGRAE